MKKMVQAAKEPSLKTGFAHWCKTGFLWVLFAVSFAVSFVVQANPQRVLMQPPASLTVDEKLAFYVGESFVHKPWVMAPSTTTARDGLGPRYNAAACADCHHYNGKMRWQPNTNQLHNLVLRLGNSAAGFQLQPRAVLGVENEGRIELKWQNHSVEFSDGFQLELRKPQVNFIASETRYYTENFSLRVAPMLAGVAVLEAIPEAAIKALAEQQALRPDNIKGRLSEIVSENGKKLGRFGWKAEVPTLSGQIALAFQQDMGITSSLYAKENCNADDVICEQQTNGGAPEISDHLFQRVVAYVRALTVPAARSQTADEKAGQQLFDELHCSACHVPAIPVGATVLRPYSDMLLHDMGEALADTLDLPNATRRHWRTAPLQGLGVIDRLSPPAYLHDGRARSLLEAVVWHGGEAEASRQLVLTLDAQKRQQLILFLQSL